MSEKKRTVYDMILAMYAGEDSMRQWLNEPFFKGEYAYATDSYCMIRVPVAKTNCAIPLLVASKIITPEDIRITLSSLNPKQ